MDWLIWGGAVVSVLGLVGLVCCIATVMHARRALPCEDEMRALLRTVLPLNMGALLLSVVGLMMVVMGIVLG
ncbi:MAG: hypothetical protein GY717_17795 [Rhodobacteraceae bacterium]|nr:hypothetical protein [Paracoccaceae bacterium]